MAAPTQRARAGGERTGAAATPRWEAGLSENPRWRPRADVCRGPRSGRRWQARAEETSAAVVDVKPSFLQAGDIQIT